MQLTRLAWLQWPQLATASKLGDCFEREAPHRAKPPQHDTPGKATQPPRHWLPPRLAARRRLTGFLSSHARSSHACAPCPSLRLARTLNRPPAVTARAQPPGTRHTARNSHQTRGGAGLPPLVASSLLHTLYLRQLAAQRCSAGALWEARSRPSGPRATQSPRQRRFASRPVRCEHRHTPLPGRQRACGVLGAGRRITGWRSRTPGRTCPAGGWRAACWLSLTIQAPSAARRSGPLERDRHSAWWPALHSSCAAAKRGAERSQGGGACRSVA